MCHPGKGQYYTPITPSYECQAYLNSKYIYGSLHILTALAPPITNTDGTATHDLQEVHNIFSAFPDWPQETPRNNIFTYPAVDNKAGTLAQSQIISDTDKPQFIQSQLNKIRGLLKMDVFDVKPMSKKPHRARILSFIWSYKYKWSPIGHIPKYKSRICIDGSQQEFGRDYWEPTPQ